KRNARGLGARFRRRMAIVASAAVALILVLTANGQTDSVVRPLEESASRGVTTRDPSDVVECGGEYWVFYTGRGVPSYHSKDLVKWERGPAVFKTAPEWIADVVPGNRNMSYWAPDIIRLGDRYLLYYSASTIGKMTSAIGLVTNPTLNPED